MLSDLPMTRGRLTLLSIFGVALLTLAGCGHDGDSEKPAPSQPTATTDGVAPQKGGANKPVARPTTGTRIVVDGSEFGDMLFDSRRQAIYIFENDARGKSVCYGECARAWPPVLTKGEPRAGKGVKAKLLGTTKRRDGKRQVTYAGKPLYFYVNEGPGEVRCHNVHLNGGLWWVVGPDGNRRP